jgi:hypothetical protein
VDRDPPAAWIARSQDAFHASRLTLQQVGVRMGYPADAARRAAWHFLYRTADPPLLEFVRFAKAVGVPVQALIS